MYRTPRFFGNGVEYRHHDSADCIRMAEERAGAALLGYLYRFEWDRNHRCLKLIAFRIVKKTPKGWRISLGSFSGTQMVLENTRRRFANPSADVALLSYLARKSRYVAILQGQLNEAKQQLQAGELPKAYLPSQVNSKRELAFLIDGAVFEENPSYPAMQIMDELS